MTEIPHSKRYGFQIWFDTDDGQWIATAPELKGCCSYGSTPEEAAKNIVEAIDLYCESAEQHGDPLPEPKFPE